MNEPRLPAGRQSGEFSPDPNREWKPLVDPNAPPSETRRNIEERFTERSVDRRRRL
ncbi:hypothetical protein [Cryobacterium sp. TMS1-13-1]|uniref:hypothetical protein n=1 Tax=Cryobacterium sp. TMS1-13-1 TaxID=1259220 RepID=UPI00141B0CE1|nr:hypothetical protein [Cryobacterium sp. TMS1-13-1]